MVLVVVVLTVAALTWAVSDADSGGRVLRRVLVPLCGIPLGWITLLLALSA